MEDFCVFILSHGRAENLYTYDTLRKGNYTGKTYIVIDDEDPQEDQYRKLYGEKVLRFSKKEIAQTFDTMDFEEDMRTVVYARNACFELAKQVGVRYFLELDDDYTSFEHRWISGDKLKVEKVKNLDAVFEKAVDFLKESGALTVAFAQGGDLIGGSQNQNIRKRVLRKAMNTFFCDVQRPFKFIGRINEDVNTYTYLGSKGEKIFTTMDISIAQKNTQKNKGGMTDVYLDNGTYLKSFYSVMVMPSAVHIQLMGDKNRRIHHLVEWENCVPKIINERYKKR